MGGLPLRAGPGTEARDSPCESSGKFQAIPSASSAKKRKGLRGKGRGKPLLESKSVAGKIQDPDCGKKRSTSRAGRAQLARKKEQRSKKERGEGSRFVITMS